MGFDAFLKITGPDVKGESKDDAHKEWIEILSFSHGISQPTSSTRSSSGGAGSGRANVQDFSIVKHLDVASPVLFQACCTGQHFGKVEFHLRRAGAGADKGSKDPYLVTTMTDAIVSSVRPGGTAHGGDEVPLEEVSLNFGTIKWEYKVQDRKTGALGGTSMGSWNLEKNTTAV
jgi:type VI secretion system secreted protein Hcp